MTQRVKELEAKIDNVSNESPDVVQAESRSAPEDLSGMPGCCWGHSDPDKTKAALVQIMEALIRQEA